MKLQKNYLRLLIKYIENVDIIVVYIIISSSFKNDFKFVIIKLITFKYLEFRLSLSFLCVDTNSF